MTKNIENYGEVVFEKIKHIDENGHEYWSARELMTALGYSKWERFHAIIEKAKEACKNSNHLISDHFPGSGKMVEIGSKTTRYVKDYKLSRYACYLIAQNGDSRKEVIALAQTYFAYQTRKMELFNKDYSLMSEEEKRIYKRKLTRKGNLSLNQTALKSGVKNFGEFHNYGYKGLYNGETADDIFKRKGLKYREDILDNMCLEELIANLFRISQTESKLKRDNIYGQNNANETHYKVGKKVRETIKELGGTMPEDLPKPNKSIKEVEDKNKTDIYDI